ncbi:hypothetical protein PGB90_008533 [Kerria lacca]
MLTKVNLKLSNITYHCSIGLFIRIVLSIYSLVHDVYFKVPYTDIDYKIFTYAAKEVLSQRSPYEQQTFRYSPIIAYILTPNVLVHPLVGKILCSIFDVYLAYCIYKIVLLIYLNQKKALQCAQLWIYNPLPIIICTRGNIDSFSSVFVLLTILYHLRQNYIASGALLGLCIHLRLYPVVFLLSLFITAGRFSTKDTFKLTYKSKLKLLTSFVFSLTALTGIFYYVYGFKFIDSSILYHVYRRDIRHNFSLYFYVQYLDSFVPDYISKNFIILDPKLTKNLLIMVPNVVLQIAVALKYNTLNHLPFCLYSSAFIFVIFNKVLTSQYFIWFFSLLPLFLPSVIISTKKLFAIIGLWCGTQALWLLSAYLLEYEGYDTFIYIHACSVLFYVVNVWILVTFINSYNVQYMKKID